jgi:hypothetical protein
MSDYLDAECVLTTLFGKKVFAVTPWKSNTTESSYNVMFTLADSARIVGFCIYIRESCHCIGVNALRNQSRFLKGLLDDILTRCGLDK